MDLVWIRKEYLIKEEWTSQNKFIKNKYIGLSILEIRTTRLNILKKSTAGLSILGIRTTGLSILGI